MASGEYPFADGMDSIEFGDNSSWGAAVLNIFCNASVNAVFFVVDEEYSVFVYDVAILNAMNADPYIRPF